MRWSRRDGQAGWATCAGTLAGAAVILTLSVGWPGASGAQDEPATGRIASLAVSPHDGVLWVGGGRGLFRSGDQGRTLAAVTPPGQAQAVEVTAVALAPGSDRTVYVATGGTGVFRGDNDGTTWVAANVGLGGLDVRGLAVSPRDGRLYAQVPGTGLYRSVNGARQWHRVDHGPAGTLHALASVNMPSGMGGIYLYAATAEGLQRNPDCF